MIVTALLSLALIAAGLLFMCVRILVRKGGRFHAQHVGQSRAMRQRGITCVQSMDATERAEARRRQERKNNNL